MRRRRIILLALATSALVLVAACGPAAPPPPPPPSSPAAADVVDRINELRSTNGLGALDVDGSMQANAQLHADRLAAGATTCTGLLWHSPELGSWYAGSAAYENLACVSGCPSDGGFAIDLWWNSSVHRDNLMQADVHRIGVATQCSGSVEVMVAQLRSG